MRDVLATWCDTPRDLDSISNKWEFRVLKEKPRGARCEFAYTSGGWIAVTLTRGWDYLQVNTQADEIQSSIKYTILYGYENQAWSEIHV